ncbi:LytTr DNA-binding domain-containing protein [Larkinella arboricola]|uniref:LytTr DNA-binding domain-containing protein n=1 Tax=Larkinella arboricola TaxID=643671 RepID=A0A327WY74_LARAB|nr:LytTR family DNA-binding domain-containing protein [Larkinella arboricola]RAJ97395.1 LytTr DNA-binding domain-containing protein [Larkinella arboricola]
MEAVRNTSTSRPVRLGVLTLKIDDQGNWIPIHEIVRIEGLSNYCRVYTTSGQVYRIAITLRKAGKRLSEFWRAHYSHLVNPNHILHVRGTKSKGRLATLTTGEAIPVARRRAEYTADARKAR